MRKNFIILFVSFLVFGCAFAGQPVPPATRSVDAVQLQQVTATDKTAVWERNTNAVHVAFYGQSNCYGYSGDGTANFLDGFQYGISNAYGVIDGYWADGTHSVNYDGILKIPTASTDAGWSMELPFAFDMTRVDGKTVYISKVAQGGMAITNFMAGTAMFTQLTNNIAQIKSTYADCPALDAFVFIQGETDEGTTALADAYYDNLTNLIASVRTAVSNDSLPFIILSLGEYQYGHSANGITVFNAQKQVCEDDDNAYFIDARNFEHPTGNAHYNSLGIIRGGNYIYNQVKSALLTPFETDSVSSQVVVGQLIGANELFADNANFDKISLKGTDINNILSPAPVSMPLCGYTFNVTSTNDYLGVNGLDDNSTPTGNDYGVHGKYLDVTSGGLGLFSTNNTPTGYMGTNDFSISFWYNRQHADDSIDYRYIFFADNTGGFAQRIYALNIQVGNQNTSAQQNIKPIICVPGETTSSRTLLTVTDACVSNTWTHYTFTVSWGDSVKAYVDGQYDTSASLSGVSFGKIDNWFSIGTRSTTFGVYESLPAQGYIDNLFIFDHALSSSEVSALYRNESNGHIGVNKE